MYKDKILVIRLTKFNVKTSSYDIIVTKKMTKGSARLDRLGRYSFHLNNRGLLQIDMVKLNKYAMQNVYFSLSVLKLLGYNQNIKK